MHRTAHRFLRTLALATPASFFALAGCSSSTEPAGNPTFAVEVSGERFEVEVASQAQADELQQRLDSGEDGVVTGSLAEGDGGFNEPWSWHMDPSTVHTADMAVEVCDGRPSMVEEDLDYWLDTVGRFCPWSAEVVARIR